MGVGLHVINWNRAKISKNLKHFSIRFRTFWFLSGGRLHILLMKKPKFYSCFETKWNSAWIINKRKIISTIIFHYKKNNEKKAYKAYTIRHICRIFVYEWILIDKFISIWKETKIRSSSCDRFTARKSWGS